MSTRCRMTWGLLVTFRRALARFVAELAAQSTQSSEDLDYTTRLQMVRVES